MKTSDDISEINSGFAKKVVAGSSVELFACFQCEKCTNGCPVTFTMDYGPHQIVRMAQFGLVEDISCANTMWVCASCETCFTRCPNGIDIPKLMDYLKQWVLGKGDKPVEGPVAAFHQAFLGNIRKFGRIHEAALMRAFQLKCMIAGKGVGPKEVLKNLKLGFSMLKRGRLALVPRKTGGKDAVRKLFEKKGT